MKLLLSLLCCLIIKASSAQQAPVYRQINVESGLISNTVYDIKILKNNLLCIAHERGLSTFDGIQIINYYNKDYPNIAVSNIMESTDGTIYCKSFSNIFFKLQCDSIQFEFKLPSDELFHYSTILKNKIIGSYHDSVYQYALDTKKLKYISVKKCIPIEQLKNVSYSNAFSEKTKLINMVVMDSNLQFATIPLYNKSNKAILNFSGRPTQYVEKNTTQSITSFYQINTFCQSNHLFVNSIIEIDSIYWICTTTGAIAFNAYQYNQENFIYFKDYNISNVQKDFQNNYWFSTTSNGLLMIPNFNIRKLNIESNKISYLQSSKNKLLYGTQNGKVFSYNTASEKSTLIGKADFEKSIEAILEIDNTLIFSSNNFYIKNKNRTYTEPFIIKDYSNFDADIFIGANNSCYLYGNSKNHDWIKKYFNQDFKTPITLLHRFNFLDVRIISTAIDNIAQRLYILTSNGLYQLDSTLTQPALINSNTATISKIKWYKNNLYLATKDNGICILNKNKILPWTLLDAQKQSSLVSNFYLHNNDLWILSEAGIFKYDGQHIATFDYSFGLPLRQIKGLQFIGDTVFCFSNDALLYFRDNKNNPTRNKPTLVIQSIKTLQQTFFGTNNISLASDNNNITINFSLIEYSNPLNCHVVYSLNNSEKIKLGNQVRTLNLPSLSSGTYTLNLYPSIDGMLDLNNKATIQFTIATPFWKSWWFLLLLLSFISSVLFVWVKNILAKQKYENELIQSKLMLEKELDRSMLSSIKAQMNPHFLFNALNTIQSYIYSNEKNNASLYISKFSNLTRSILEMSTKDTITLDEELKSLSLYLELEKMRFEDSFNFYFEIAPSVNKELITIPSMLLQPYVENAIKHGLLHKKTNRILTLKFCIEENMLKITIDDNGIGRKRSQELNKIKNRQHTSFAMDANKKRLEILKNNFKKIEFEIIDKYSSLGEAIGTKVIITLPI